MDKHEIYRKAAWLSGLAAVLVMAGCASTPPVPPSDTLAGTSEQGALSSAATTNAATFAAPDDIG